MCKAPSFIRILAYKIPRRFINIRNLTMLMSEMILQQIAQDVRLIRQELSELKEEVNDLRDVEVEVRPEFLEKLKMIDSGNFKKFSSVDDLRKQLETD